MDLERNGRRIFELEKRMREGKTHQRKRTMIHKGMIVKKKTRYQLYRVERLQRLMCQRMFICPRVDDQSMELDRQAKKLGEAHAFQASGPAAGPAAGGA